MQKKGNAEAGDAEAGDAETGAITADCKVSYNTCFRSVSQQFLHAAGRKKSGGNLFGRFPQKKLAIHFPLCYYI